MARKSVFRRNYIKIGLIALVVIILFGIVASITDVFVVGFEAIPFTVPISFTASQLSQLALASNFAVDCRIWVQGDIVDVNGGKTSIGFKTQTFNPQFQLELINIQTEQIIDRIDTDIRIRCDPGSVSGFTFGEVSGGLISEYVLTGGTVQYFWVVDDEDNTERIVTSKVTRNISANDNVLQTPQGGGITLASPSVTGTQIDNALTSNKEVYFTSAKLVVTANPIFRFTLGCDAVPPVNFACAVDQTEFATVSLNAGIGTVKIFNQVIDPPKPTSEIVKITKIATEIGNVEQPLFSDSTGNLDLVIRIQLPAWTAAEGVPQIDIFKPLKNQATITSGSTVDVVSQNFAITAKKNVQSGCNSTTDSCTFEFFDTNIALPDNPISGQWLVVAHHNGRTGEDLATFTVLQRGNQGAEDPIVIECDVQQDPKCESVEQQKKSQEPRGDDNGDNGNGLTNFLSIGDLVDCFQGVAKSGAFEGDVGLDDLDLSCFNDSKFTVIYGIFAVIILISILSAIGSRR